MRGRGAQLKSRLLLLDPDVLAKSLEKLLEREAAGEVIAEGLLQTFSDYVKAGSSDQQAAQRLLFHHDRKDVKCLFEKAQTRSTVRKFVEETLLATMASGSHLSSAFHGPADRSPPLLATMASGSHLSDGWPHSSSLQQSEIINRHSSMSAKRVPVRAN